MAKKTKADPTGLRDRRQIAYKKIAKKLKEANVKIRKLIAALGFTRVTEKTDTGVLSVIYDYRLDADEARILYQQIRDIVNEAVLGVKNPVFLPPDWFWKLEIELPYRKGTVEQVKDFNAIIQEAAKAGVSSRAIPIRAVPVDIVLTSPSYLSQLNSVYIENFEQFKTLSNKTADQVVQSLNNGIQSGLSRKEIAEDVADRFKVADANAERITKTEINKAYNDAKLKAITNLGEETGLNAKAMHISALSPTTRETHAARHNKLYTPNQQTRWWNKDANRINCKCTVQAVLLDNEGNVVSQDLARQIRE